LISHTLIGKTIMNQTDLQHQLTQTAEVTSTLFIYMPILLLMIPILLVYILLRSLRISTIWIASLLHDPKVQ